MRRSAFFRSLLAAPAALLSPGTGYVPIGRVDAEGPKGKAVKGVTLDGQEVVVYAFQADDIEGWVRRWVPDPDRPDYATDQVELLRAEVRFIWNDRP